MKEQKTIVIIGGGPAGAAVGTYLVRAGHRVALITDDKRPELVVGESLIPAVIPILNELGVEDDVSLIGTFKPGATIHVTPEIEYSFYFNTLEEPLHQYAFNVPRDKFDAIIMENAIRSGVNVFKFRAELSANLAEDTIILSESTIAKTCGFLAGQPDFVIDATGRTRVFARLLGIKEKLGNRKDTALFAHQSTADIMRRGNVHMSIFSHGWSWRIPLPGRVSVGMVAPTSYFEQFGDSAEAQYDGALANDPILAPRMDGAKRVTNVMKYFNYQLISDRMVGKNWAMVGDAAGFIDPVFSSGVCVSLTCARDCAKAYLSGEAEAMEKYEAHTKYHLNSWQQVVDSFYDKSFLKLLVRAKELRKTRHGSRIMGAFDGDVSRVISGVGVLDPVSLSIYKNLLQSPSLSEPLPMAGGM